ncbi:MAG: SpoIIE family protein phosphatase [Planctomycetia bacterium]|nr:SpoIIE family protein phosphatase [Planctomycetia bacterium]
MRFSIRTKLVLAIGAPLLAVYLGMACCEYYLGRSEALANMRSRLTELAARQAAELDGDLSKAEELARTLALSVASSPTLSADQVHGLLRDNLRGNPGVYGMSMAFERNAFSKDVAGFAPYYCRDPRAGLRFVDIAKAVPDYTSLDWYRPAKTDACPFWTEPYFDTGVGHRFMCTYTAPIVQHGELRGVVTVDVSSEDLLQEISRVQIAGGYCVLVSGKGTFISHPDPSLVLRESIFSLAERHGLDELADAGRQMVAGKEGVRRIRDYGTGEPKWMIYAPVGSAGWSLAAVIPESEVMKPIHARLARFLAFLGAGLAVILGIIWLMSARVTRPITRLAAAAERLGHGDLDTHVSGVSGSDEVARLAQTFNAMVVRLKTNIECRLREETARRAVDAELRSAGAIQASLLPGMLPPDPEREFTLHAAIAPAKLVAGDFYDFFFIDDRRLALVMADVSGKGIPAAIYMAVTRTKLRDFAAPDKTPAEVVAELNRSLAAENDGCMFVTMVFGYYDVATGELIYVNAGHNPPYVVRQTGGLDILDPTGPLVAPFHDATFDDARCRLEPDDMLVLFTDGVTEARLEGGQLFGEERLEELLRSRSSSPVADVCGNIIRAANDFTSGNLPDDATVLALRRTCRKESLAEPPAALPSVGQPPDATPAAIA